MGGSIVSVEWEQAYRSVEHNLDDRIAKIREFELDNSKQVLDLGCGDGLDVEAFRQLGFTTVCGVDISHSLVWALNGDEFNMPNCDVYDIALQDGAVELVYGNNGLHHFRDLERALAEIRRVVRRGGLLCFAEPRASLFRRMVDTLTMSPLSKMSKTLHYRRVILEEEMNDYQHWLNGQDRLFGLVEGAGFKMVDGPAGQFHLFAKCEAV